MGLTKCQFYNCVNTNGNRSMFRFPVNNTSRLKLWIENSGNLKLTYLTQQELRRRYICEAHFDPKYIQRHMSKATLLRTAVPFKYDHIGPPCNLRLTTLTGDELKNQYLCEVHFDQCYINENEQQRRLVGSAIPRHHHCHNESMDVISSVQTDNSFIAKLTPEMLKIRRQCKYHFEKRYKNVIDREGNESESEEEENDDDDDDGDSYDANYECEPKEEAIHQITFVNEPNDASNLMEIKNIGVTGVEAAPTCVDCETPISGFGFQWWCLQCGGLRCSQCALRMSHRPHLLLRSPANTTPEHARIVIEAIRNELQHEDFFKPRDDEDTIPNVIDEPVVKAEPPDEADDPLAESNNSSRLTLEKNIDPPMAFQVTKSGDHNIESINHRSNETRSQAGPPTDLNIKHSNRSNETRSQLSTPPELNIKQNNHRSYKSHAQPNKSGDHNIESIKHRSNETHSQPSTSVDHNIEPFNRSNESHFQPSTSIDLNIQPNNHRSNKSQSQSVDHNIKPFKSHDSHSQCSSPIDLDIDLIDQQSNDSQTDLTLNDSNYQPSQKSLDLVNLLQYQQNLDYLGLKDSDRPIESLCLTSRPNKKKRREKKCTCDNDIDYRPSEESIQGFKNQPGQVVGPDDYINNSLFSFYKDGERVSLGSEDIRCSVGLQSASKGPGSSVTGVRLPNENSCQPSTKKMRAETCTRDQEKDSLNTKTQIFNKLQQPITPNLTKDKSSNREIIVLNFDKPDIHKTQSSAEKR